MPKQSSEVMGHNCPTASMPAAEDASAAKAVLAGVTKERRAHNIKAARFPHGTSRPYEEVLRDDWAMTHRVKVSAREELRSKLAAIWHEQGKQIIRRLRQVQRSGQAVRAMHGAWRSAASAKEDPNQAIHRLIIQRLIEWEDWKERIRGEVEPIMQRIIQEGHETGQVRIGVSGVDFTSDVPFVRQKLGETLALVESTEDTWSRNLARTIQRGLSEGDDFDDLVGRAQEQQEFQTGSRLRRTVRTAGNGGFEAGQLQAWRDVGVAERSWVTERDFRVRGTSEDVWDHRSADRQTQPLDQPFIITTVDGFSSESLMYPNAPEGSASNTVNCRCGQSAELSRENLPESLQ